MKSAFKKQLNAVAALFGTIAVLSIAAFGHCDTMDGPVVKAAQEALRTKHINHVLIWVHATEEAEVRQAFTDASKVRRLGRDARMLADKYFFETVVRLHRAGEGEPYTGLKPTGTAGAKLFVEIDNAIEKNSLSELISRFPADEQTKIEDHFRNVIDKKKFGVDDVEAGRRYVESYVTFLHLLEKIEGHGEG